MPNIKSAKKRLRQDAVRQVRNRSAKSEVRTLARKVLESVKAGNIAEAESGLRLAAKRLDQVSAKGVIHKNAAARKKSRLSAAITRAKQAKS